MNSRCPIDATDLSDIEAEGVSVLACEKCFGAWLPSVSVTSLFSKLPGGMKQYEKLHGSLQSDGRPSAMKCLECGQAMRTVAHRTVEIDVCPECSAIWFDGGEMKRFRQSTRGKAAALGALAAGGVALGAAGLAGANAASPEAAANKDTLASTVGDVGIEGVFDVAGEVVGAILGALFD